MARYTFVKLNQSKKLCFTKMCPYGLVRDMHLLLILCSEWMYTCTKRQMRKMESLVYNE